MLKKVPTLDLDVMRITINKENRKFCVMQREESIWKSLGVKTETWEDSITIRIGYRGQDYEFQVHKVKKAVIIGESTCCPSAIISPVTKQDGLVEQHLELTHEVPNGGVLKSSMAKSQSISFNSNKSSTFKDGAETPSKMGLFGLRLERVTSHKSISSDSRREQSSCKLQNSGFSGSGSSTNSEKLRQQLDKFLNSWRECSNRPNLKSSITFLEKELMNAECKLLDRPLVRTVNSGEEKYQEFRVQKGLIHGELPQSSQTRPRKRNSEEAGTLELDMGFIWGESQDSLETSALQLKKGSESSKFQNASENHKDSSHCSRHQPGAHQGCSHSKKKESPSKSGLRSHKQLKEATDEKLCQFVLEKRDPRQTGGPSASKTLDILAELAFLEQQEDERIRKASADTNGGNNLMIAADGLKEQQKLQEEIQSIGCSICYSKPIF